MKKIKSLRKTKKIFFIFYLLALPLLMMSTKVYAQMPITIIEVFVDHPLLVTGIPQTDITVFDLSLKDAVKATAPKFPPDPKKAEVLAKQWLESEAGKTYIEDLKAAYNGHAKMIAYEVLKVPAIVFDQGKFVIYGTTDVQQAVKDYDHYLLTHKPANTPPASSDNE